LHLNKSFKHLANEGEVKVETQLSYEALKHFVNFKWFGSTCLRGPPLAIFLVFLCAVLFTSDIPSVTVRDLKKRRILIS